MSSRVMEIQVTNMLSIEKFVCFCVTMKKETIVAVYPRPHNLLNKGEYAGNVITVLSNHRPTVNDIQTKRMELLNCAISNNLRVHTLQFADLHVCCMLLGLIRAIYTADVLLRIPCLILFWYCYHW